MQEKFVKSIFFSKTSQKSRTTAPSADDFTHPPTHPLTRARALSLPSQETEQLERENKNKRDIVRLLQEEKENLAKVLEDHESKCGNLIIYDPKSNPQLA